MAAIPSDTPTDVCPIREGDRFRESAATLTVVEIVESVGQRHARIESTRVAGTTIRYRMPVRDVRERVRRGCWHRIER